MAKLEVKDEIMQFLEPNGTKFKTLSKIDLFLKIYLGVHNEYKWEICNKKILKRYASDIEDIYTNYRVLVYFPTYNIRIDMPIYKASKITVVKVFLENNFSEEAIKFKYYNEKLKKVMNGPIIVIINLPLESVLLEDGESLFSKIED
jgi:hypothetical protein